MHSPSSLRFARPLALFGPFLLALGLLGCGDDGAADTDMSRPDQGVDQGADQALDQALDLPADATNDTSDIDMSVTDMSDADIDADMSVIDMSDADVDMSDADVDMSDADVDMSDADIDMSEPLACEPPGACDPLVDATSSGCDPGHACILGSDGLTSCVEMSVPGMEGDPCAAHSECAHGLLCVTTTGDGTRCRTLCAEGSIGACGELRCSGLLLGESCLQFCRPLDPPCDIYAQDCASEGDACTLSVDPESGERYTGCRPQGTQAQGERCGGSEGSCVAGTICIRGDEGVARCQEVCDPEGDATCHDATESCTGRSTDWGVGFCRFVTTS